MPRRWTHMSWRFHRRAHPENRIGSEPEREIEREHAQTVSRMGEVQKRSRVCLGGWVGVSVVPRARDTSEYCVYCAYLHHVWYCAYCSIAILQYCAYYSIAHTEKKQVLRWYPWICPYPCVTRGVPRLGRISVCRRKRKLFRMVPFWLHAGIWASLLGLSGSCG